MSKKLIINTDGGARGNPGPAGIGVTICDEDGATIGEFKKYIGTATNNVAEYKALLLALEEAGRISNAKFQISKIPSPLTPPSASFAKASTDKKGEGAIELEIRMDSELIVRQMQGRYKIKEPTLKLLAQEVLTAIKNFKHVSFHHVRRELNKRADQLVNQALDES